MKAPDAPQTPTMLEKHGHQRNDPYFWMNQRDSKPVLDYIQAENAYSASYFGEMNPLVEALMTEFDNRIDPHEKSAPFEMNKVLYQWQSLEGKDYRQLIIPKTAEVIVFFDENERAKGHEYYGLGELENSPNNLLLAVSEDIVGRRKYTLQFRDNATNKYLKDKLTNTDGSIVWANDNKTVFYVKKDETTLREFQVYKHVLGTSQSKDQLVYQEDDERFAVFITKSMDDAMIFIYSQSSTTSEVSTINAGAPAEKPQVFLARQKGHLYQIDHHENGFYILSNWEAPNRTLRHSATKPVSIEACSILQAHNTDTYIDGFIAFKNQLVIQERTKGKTRFLYGDLKASAMQEVRIDEEVYEIGLGWNDNYEATSFLYSYTSMTVPASVIKFDMSTGNKETIFQRVLRNAYNPEDYKSERVWATANDGTKIPISLVYKKGTDLKKAPLLLYGYGSYGVTIPTTFSPYRLSLLDRGFVFAIAHVRGGKFMGESWYEDGKLQHKRHTFTDFINCAEWLSMKGYCNPDAIYAQGGSAGGLLMGAVTNMAPYLFKGIVAQVPFVDVVTTMLDESIPLTVGEYEEWGNPNEEESYWYMLSYSPYDQVKKTAYPAMLITTGYHDSQVQYWEPLKWVAKLRDLNTGNQPILFDCTMSAGHGGGSGRTTERMEIAKEYVFLLTCEGITN
ncbi:MAG: S9 family peptidase [Fluviicola sp.]|nr:S9 family peptidase [Fluviicola sp.]